MPTSQPIQFGSSSGTFDAAVIDNNGTPSNILEADKPFTIRTSWKYKPDLLGGTWEIQAYAESIGPGPEIQIGPTVTKAIDGSGNYSADIVVPAGTLPDNTAPVPAGTPPPSGFYRFVAVLVQRAVTGKRSDNLAIGLDESFGVF